MYRGGACYAQVLMYFLLPNTRRFCLDAFFVIWVTGRVRVAAVAPGLGIPDQAVLACLKFRGATMYNIINISLVHSDHLEAQ